MDFQKFHLRKTSYLEEITYSVLVDKICRKIAIDETTTKLKLSYIPLVVNPHRESYILDDGDVYVYLTTLDKERFRSVLHVEIIKDLGINQRGEQLSRAEQGSSFVVNYGEMDSNGRSDDVVNDGNVLAIYAELVRTIHKDSSRAETYFNQVVAAAPEDCYVQASYADFFGMLKRKKKRRRRKRDM